MPDDDDDDDASHVPDDEHELDDDDGQEHDIFILINLHDGAGHHCPDNVRIDDHRGTIRTLDLDHHDGPFLVVLRALHDRRPALYHDGEPDDDAASCNWCAALAARRASAAGHEMAP